MKTPYFILCVALLTAFIANGQGTLVYDQQSSTNAGAGGAGAPITEDQPMGQSFTPTLSSVGFVQLEFDDGHSGNGLGATVFVNLWSGSISNGTLMSSTDPVFMPDGFGSGSGGFGFLTPTNFYFSTPVSITPGTTYYFQPVVVQPGSDDPWDVIASAAFNYPGGTFYFNGAPDPNNHDLWFREGIIDVPEPSSATIILLGSGLFLYARHKKHPPL
jgi:hypothetical protein